MRCRIAEKGIIQRSGFDQRCVRRRVEAGGLRALLLVVDIGKLLGVCVPVGKFEAFD